MSNITLVTGGLGFLGVSLVRHMIERGDTVRVFDNSSRGSVEKLGEMASQVEIVEGDIRDPEAVEKAVKGVQRVCHLAYVNGTKFFYEHPDYVLDVAVKGMMNVVDSSIRNNVPDFVLASSSEVYQTPPEVPTDESARLIVPDIHNPRYSYGGGKILCELVAMNYRNHFERSVIFRPHNVYGPNMGYEHVIPDFAVRLRGLVDEGKSDPMPFTIQGDGSHTRAFIHVDDFTRGLLAVVDKGVHGEVYHIGSEEEVSMGDLARMVASCKGRTIELVPQGEAKGGTPRRCPDITKLKSLGYSASVPLQEGLQQTVDWYWEHPPGEKKAHREPKLWL